MESGECARSRNSCTPTAEAPQKPSPKKGSCFARGYQGRPEETSEHSGIQRDNAAGRGKSTWLTPAEAVEESGIGRTRLYGFLTSGALPSAKVGRTRHIRRQDLDRFLEERMMGTPDALPK